MTEMGRGRSSHNADYQILIENIPAGVVVTDHNGIILYLNSACEVLFNCNKEKLLGQMLGNQTDFDKEAQVDIFRLNCKPGFALMKTVKIDWGENEANLIFFHDITERREAEEEIEKINLSLESKVAERTAQLEKEIEEHYRTIVELQKAKDEADYLSYHDALTGLYNRRFYQEEIKRLDTARNLPITLIMGDVNGLKLTNDVFGHAKGDDILIRAATAIKNTCRTDDIVARWGGDEFVILLPKTETMEAEEIVRRIQVACATENTDSIKVNVSFGWDAKREPDEDIIKVLKNAEDEMYRHKIIENEGLKGSIINTIIQTLHEKSPREAQHANRVSEICQDIGRALELNDTEISRLKVVGLLHDIGKIAIKDGILDKPGKLTEQEMDEIKKHPVIGARIIQSSNNMLELADCIGAHHERWDGKGYPKGLQGEDIPMISRIITIADSYDAMTSERIYREKLSDEEAYLEIRKNIGIQFDPEISRVFIEKILRKSCDAKIAQTL